jgi:hypothetical protein
MLFPQLQYIAKTILSPHRWKKMGVCACQRKKKTHVFTIYVAKESQNDYNA